MKKKILYIVNTDKFFLSHRFSVANYLKKKFDISLATNFILGEIFFKKKGFKTYKLTINRSSLNIFSNILILMKIFIVIKNCKPDLIHFISSKPVIIGGLASRFFKIPKVFSISGLGSVFIGDNLISKLRKFFFLLLYKISLNQKYYKVIFQNKSDYLEINKFNTIKKNYKLIPGSGVCLSKFRPKYQNSKVPIVMFPSRMLRHKGLIEFLQAAEILKKNKINAKFVLVGEIDIHNPSGVKISEINKWTSSGTVEYWGYSSNMNKILNLSTIVVLPSYREGFPKILMEAAACGKPVITTNVPGCRDAVINNFTGKIIPMKNSNLLALAIKNLLSDKNKIRTMSKNARKHAEKNFDVKKIIQMHLKVYQSLINN